MRGQGGHNIEFSVPRRKLGGSDIEFQVKRNGAVLGTLKVSNGSLAWLPRKTTVGHRMGWVKVSKVMRDYSLGEERR